MKLFILSLKIIGIILAGIFGYVGTIHEYKDSSGKITRWGKLALYGIPLSILLTVITLVYDELDNQFERNRLDTDLQNIAYNVKRGQSLIESIGLEFPKIKYPYDEEGDMLYYWYLVDSAIYSMPLDTFEFNGLIRYPRTIDTLTGNLIHSAVEITKESEVHPSRFMNYLLGPLLNIFMSDIKIYKDPIPLDDFQPYEIVSSERKPDIHIYNLSRPDYNDDSFKSLSVVRSYTSSDSLYLTGGFDLVKKEDWIEKTDEIISVYDLDGSQIFFSIGTPAVGIGDDSEGNNIFQATKKQFEIESVSLLVNDLEIRIDSSSLEKVYFDGWAPYWVAEINLDKMLLSN